MLKISLFLLIISWSTQVFPSIDYRSNEKATLFSGRVSRINPDSHLMRLKISFQNMKFLNVNDRLEFWNASYPERRCASYVKARSNNYLLIKIPKFKKCVAGIYITTGTYLHLYSPDMEKNMNTANELMKILLKKKMALESKKSRYEKDLRAYVERIELLNKRYEVLRQKLELEWRKELNLLEEDKSKSYVEFKHIEARLNELEHKMEKYRVHNENLKEDRWSLDPKYYLKK